MFFEPFKAVDSIKKGDTQSFAIMLFVACAVMAAAMVLLLQTSVFPEVTAITKTLPRSAGNSIMYFAVLCFGLYVSSLIKAFFIHLVMKIFTDKGEFADAFKVTSANTYLMAGYMIVAMFIALIPVIGVPLGTLIFAIGCLITLAVTIKALAVLYKADIISTCIALGVLMMVAMMTFHLALFGSVKW